MGAYYNENFVRGRLELVEKMGYEMEGRFRIGDKNKNKRKSEAGKKENELKVLRGSGSLSKEEVKGNESSASVTSQENYTTPRQNQVMGRGNASKEEDQVNESSALPLMTSQKDYMPHQLQVFPASAPNEVHYTNPQDRSLPFPSITQPIIPMAAKTTATHYTPHPNQAHPVSISHPAFSPMRRTNPRDRHMASLPSALPTGQAAVKTPTAHHHHSAAASETHVNYPAAAASSTASDYSGNPELVWPRRHLMERQREVQSSAARPMPVMTYESASVAGYTGPVGYAVQARGDADTSGPPSNHPAYAATSTAFPSMPATIGYAEHIPEIEYSTDDPSPVSSIDIQVPVDSGSGMSAYYTTASTADEHIVSAEYAGHTVGKVDCNINAPTPASNIIHVPVDNGSGMSTYYTAASTTAQDISSTNYVERILETERYINHGDGPFPLYHHQNIINNIDHVDQDLIAFHDCLARTASKVDLNKMDGLCDKQVPITEVFGGSTVTGGRAVATSQEEEWKFDIVDIP